MGFYDVAQVCPNGHVANSSARERAASNKDYCDRCGEKTITACPDCGKNIKGDYHYDNVSGFIPYNPPAFCQYCGSAFPWTKRAMEAAITLANESGDLSQDEQDQFAKSVEAITRDTPEAKVAGGRIVRLLKKMGQVTADAVKDTLVNVASEAVKKLIFPDK